MAHTPSTAMILRRIRREQGRPLRESAADIGIHRDREDVMPRAPKHCSQCMNVALPGQRNCAECGNSRWPEDDPRRYERMRSPEMLSLREFVFERDKDQCQIGYVGICEYGATDLDHKVPLWKGGSDIDPENLQAACRPCHAAKSSDEGHEAQGHKTSVRQRISSGS